MAIVSFTSWKPGFQKTKCSALLRERLGLSLSEAKRVVDAILENQTVSVETASTQEAAILLLQAELLGVIGELPPLS